MREPQMMRVAGLASADQTGLLGDIAHVIAIANTPRFGVHQDGFVNRLGRGLSIPPTPVLGAGGLDILFWSGDLSFGAMNGKAQKLGPKRLLDMLGIGRSELVLFSHPPVRPLGGLILAANLVQFSEHHIAQPGGCHRVKENGSNHTCFAAINDRWFRPHNRGSRSKLRNLAVDPTVEAGFSLAVPGGRLRWSDEVWRIEIILAGNTDKREQGVAAGIGQRGTHAVWGRSLGNGT